MRLTDEDIRRHKENIYSVECVRGKVKMSDGDIIHNLCDTIEALQQENEQLRSGKLLCSRCMEEWQKKIESQQQEIEQLKDENASLRNWNACEAEQFSELLESDKRRIELEEEVEQLQAQVAELRDSLKWLKSISFSHEDDLEQWPSQETREPIEHALSNSMGIDYHNPADVALLQSQEQLIRQYCKDIVGYLVTLAKAREVFAQVQHDIDGAECRDDLDGIKGYIDEALAAIDKVIGGKEDAGNIE